MTTRPTVVGLISDTHGLLRPEIARLFAQVDLIVHAGDVGGHGVLDALRAMAPVEAVSGNVDDPHDPMLARERAFPVQALMLHVSHGDELGQPTPELLLARYAGDILVYGHTHKPLTFRDDGGRLVINPGAAGPRRFNVQPTVARLTVFERSADVELIQIG
jgi:putative phosphoesterase